MKIFFYALFIIFFHSLAFATHERAGEITYEHIDGLKYKATIVTYTYTPSPANRPELTISWGDGTASIIPRHKYVLRCKYSVV